MSSLNVMIPPEPKKYVLGGKTLYLAPVPMFELKRKVLDSLQQKVSEVIEQFAKTEPGEKPTVFEPLKLVDGLLGKFDFPAMVCALFESVVDIRTGKKLNDDPELTPEWFSRWLTAPLMREIFEDFIRQNEIEDVIKNLRGLPAVGEAVKHLETFGGLLLNYSATNTERPQ